MSSLVKQKRLSSKAIVSIAIAVISVLAIAVGALTIFALGQHTFNSSVKISYQAKDIAGKVTMYAKAAPKASNYTAKVDSEKIGEFEFTPTTDTTENPAEINMDDVELDSTDNALYLHYYFENDGTRAYTAILNYNLTDIITNQNMTLEYSESGAEGSYKNANSGLVVPGNSTKDYFVKISVADLGLDADFEGMFTWQLNECDDSLTAMEEISLTATEFTVISEEDNTYSAKYNGSDISVTNVSGAGELSAQSNTIENIWYVPARIGTGRVISVVESGTDENGNQIYLPANTKVVITDGVTSIENKTFYYCSGLLEITIPNSVTSIGSDAFINCDSVTSIEIPDSVTSIGQSAFSSCASLTNVTIGKGVTSIGSMAFYYCESLTSVTIGSGVTSIGIYAFSSCASLTSIEIPDSVTSIGQSAFNGCKGLTSIEIPDSVTSIGDSAFSSCTSLTNVTIGKGVTSIGQSVFNGCKGLTSITVDKNNPTYHSAGNCLIETVSKTLILGCKLSIIPDDGSVTSIGSNAFQYCASLTSIEIPNSVTSIGTRAFSYCTSLTIIEIPNSVTSIGSYAFSGCTGLTSVTFKTTSGWWYSTSSTATGGTTLSSTSLANTNTAATWLKSTYAKYYWKRT